MSTIAQYNAKISEFNSIKNTVYGIIDYLDMCKTNVDKSSNDIETLVVNGKAIDDGVLVDISSSLDSLRGDLSQIINECNTKINYYTNLIASLSEEDNESVDL